MTLSRKEQSRRRIIEAAKTVAQAQPGLSYRYEIVEAVEEELSWELHDESDIGSLNEPEIAVTAYRDYFDPNQ